MDDSAARYFIGLLAEDTTEAGPLQSHTIATRATVPPGSSLHLDNDGETFTATLLVPADAE